MTGDTFRAVSRHAAADPLIAPGEVDLSAHVDFRAHRRARRALPVPWPMGRSARASSSAGSGSRRGCAGCSQRRDPGAAHGRSTSGCARLMAADAMGELFKVLALTARGGPVPPGFTDAGATAMKLESEALGGLPGVRHGFFGRAGRRQRRCLGFAQRRACAAATGRSGSPPTGRAPRRRWARRRAGWSPPARCTACTALAVTAPWDNADGARGRRAGDRSAGPAPGRAHRRLRPGPAGRPRGGRDRRRARRLEGCARRRAGRRGRGDGRAGCRAGADHGRAGPLHRASLPTRSARSSWRASPPQTPANARILRTRPATGRGSTSRAIIGATAAAGRGRGGSTSCRTIHARTQSASSATVARRCGGEERFGLQLSAIVLEG